MTRRQRVALLVRGEDVSPYLVGPFASKEEALDFAKERVSSFRRVVVGLILKINKNSIRLLDDNQIFISWTVVRSITPKEFLKLTRLSSAPRRSSTAASPKISSG